MRSKNILSLLAGFALLLASLACGLAATPTAAPPAATATTRIDRTPTAAPTSPAAAEASAADTGSSAGESQADGAGPVTATPALDVDPATPPPTTEPAPTAAVPLPGDFIEYRDTNMAFLYPQQWRQERFPEAIVVGSNERIIDQGPGAADSGAFVGFLTGSLADFPGADLVDVARSVAADLGLTDDGLEPAEIETELVIQGQRAVRLTYELEEPADQEFVGFIYIIANDDRYVAAVAGTSQRLRAEFEPVIAMIVGSLQILNPLDVPESYASFDFLTDELLLNFAYPAGWYVTPDDDTLVISTNAELGEGQDLDELGANFAIVVAVDPGYDPAVDVLEYFRQLEAEFDELSFRADPSTLTVDDAAAATAPVRFEENGVVIDGFMTYVAAGETGFFAVVLGPPEYEATLATIHDDLLAGVHLYAGAQLQFVAAGPDAGSFNVPADGALAIVWSNSNLEDNDVDLLLTPAGGAELEVSLHANNPDDRAHEPLLPFTFRSSEPAPSVAWPYRTELIIVVRAVDGVAAAFDLDVTWVAAPTDA